MEQFQKRKSQTLASISSPIPDKSPKGFLDAPIVPLINAINSHSSFFTTSSCSGRISVLSHPSPNPNPSSTEKKKKAGGGGWVFVTHEPADPEEVVESVFGRSHENGDGGLLVFRFEPLIIAVECLDVEAANMMVAAAVSCGFRESGITGSKRVIVAIRCSIRLEVPLGQVGSIMVSQEYVRYLVGIANEKMETNRKRTDGLLHVLRSKVLSGSAKQMIIDEKNEGCRIDKGSSLHFEAKQIGSLSNTKPSKIDASDCHNLNHIVDHLKDSCHSAFGSLSNEDKHIESSSKDVNLLHELEAEYNNEEPHPARTISAVTEHGQPISLLEAHDSFCHRLSCDLSTDLSGTHGKPELSISVDILVTVGELNEKLFLWGQSACTLDHREPKQIIVFGGFGGVGRHARRNYSLMLDPRAGHLNEIDARGPPSPRLGHTSSMVGDQVFIIGGRCGPSEILNEVWALDMSENRWMVLECTGNVFLPRHRHAAAVVGSNIYVFGGLNGEVILSCMTVLNTDTFQWSEVSVQGDWPSARHSHSLIANGPLLYMFGGYDGEKTLGDLYSFDVRTCLWNKEMTSGRAPFPRFSHCMFIYKNYIGILGGCPVRQQNQELSLLNLEHKIWIHVTINSVGRDLWVRSSTCVIDDDLVIIGGGTSCYAFGTKFNQPMKLNLQLIDSLYGMTCARENEPPAYLYKAVSNISHSDKYLLDTSHSSNSNHRIDIAAAGNGNYINAKCFVLQVKKKYAKFVKDLLKHFGWLDRSRKAQPSQDDHHVQLPVSKCFYSFYQIECLNLVATEADFCQHQLGISSKDLALNDVSLPMALKFLSSCGLSLQSDDVSCHKKVSKAPKKIMKELICTLLRKKGMPPLLLEQLPTRWERIGDITVLPVNSFKDPIWDSIGDELWQAVAKSLGAQRLARQGRILPTGTRDSTLEILVGDGGWVTHQENGILYSFDPTKCMFSSGNHSEKLRMARLDCREEVVVDLFAGIGYFVLPFLVKAKAKLVYACEWNPHAIKALQHNIQANFVADRCIILEGDNRVTTPKGVANRVCLGLLPSSESSWATAVKALRPEGGVLHVHENVKDSEEKSWSEYALESISSIAQSEGLCWEVTIQHLEHVKWYGPHIRHVVADISCQQLQT